MEMEVRLPTGDGIVDRRVDVIDRGADLLEIVIAGAKAGDLIAFGHTHKPWQRTVDGIHFVNTGSVGRPKDGDWRAGYVLLDIGVGEPRVEFVRVEYDLAEAIRGIRASDLPHDFAEYLSTGGRPTGPAGPAASAEVVSDPHEAPA